MSIDNYIAEIRNKKAFKVGVISAVEKSKAGFFSLPQADSTTHIVVMKIQGNHPIFHRVLNETNPSLSVGDLYRQYLFISVRMNPKTLKIPTKQYHLKGRRDKQIEVAVTLRYRVLDARKIVTNEDVLDEIEALIDRKIRTYLNQLSIVDDQVKLEQSLRDYIEDACLATNADFGLNVEKATISVELGPSIIEISQTPRTHRIEAKKYNLKDRTAEPVEVAVALIYRTTAFQDSQEHQESLEQLELLVSDAVTAHLNQVSEVDFAELQTSLRKQIERACQPHSIELKIQVDKVSVEVNFTAEQLAHLESIIIGKRAKDKEYVLDTYGLDRDSDRDLKAIALDEKRKLAIDKRLQNDMMYGMPLKDVIMRVDPALLIDFYKLDWNQGLKNLQAKLRERIEEEKRRYEEEGMRQLKNLRDKIRLLKEAGVDDRDIEDLHDQMIEVAKAGDSVNMPSDVEIRNRILSEPFPVSKQPLQLTNRASNNDPQ